MEDLENSRKLKGLEIAKEKENQISRIDTTTYRVLSKVEMANTLFVFLRINGDVSAQITVLEV